MTHYHQGDSWMVNKLTTEYQIYSKIQDMPFFFRHELLFIVRCKIMFHHFAIVSENKHTCRLRTIFKIG